MGGEEEGEEQIKMNNHGPGVWESKQKEATRITLPHLEPINDAFVLGGIDLDPAFDEIERDDGRVRDAA